MAWAPDYITSAEAKAYLRITHSDDDVQIADAITAASRAIDLHCCRQFGVVAAPEERFYTAYWDRRRCRWLVDIDDVMSTSGFVVEADGDALTAYTLEPRNAAAKSRPWTTLVVDSDSAVVPTGAEYEMAVTGLWGWTAVPTAVKAACKLQTSRFHQRRTSPYGIAGSPETGGELRLLSKVDADVGVMLRPYAKWWAAA